jgi:hypothetical protein
MALLKAVIDTLEGVEEHFHALYTNKNGKFEFTGVEGMKTSADTDRLQTALTAERKLKKEAEDKLALWGDRKPEEVIAILDKVPELEATAEAGRKKLDEKQIEAIVNSRVTPLQKDLDKALASVKERDAKLAEHAARETRRTVFDAVRKLATESKASPEAYASEYGGLMLLAERLFTVDAAGQVVVKEGVADLTFGSHAKDVWSDIQRQHSYLWPPSQGGGAQGSGAGAGGTANPFKGNDMTARSEFAKNFPDKVDSMVKAAGLQNAWDQHKAK